jgi:hypothetical protein
MFGVTQLNASSCLFLILLMLSFALSVTNVVDENNSQVLPITTLVVNCIVILLILLQTFGVKALANLGELNLVIFVVVLGLSFVQSLQNVTDSGQERKSLPTIVLVVNSVVLLMVAYQVVMNLTKK